MNRRDFLQHSGCLSALALWPAAAAAAQGAGAVRRFDIRTRIEVLRPSGRTKVWMPLALSAAYQSIAKRVIAAPGGTYRVIANRPDALTLVAAEFPAGVAPVVTIASTITTRPYAVDLTRAVPARTTPAAELDHFRRATKLLPTDGIVKATADKITRSAASDADKARAIYDWIVENTAREASVRGCGVGDIRSMLESNTLTGKCADLNALFVGLARAAGLPARDVYGVRVGPSRLGYKSLGLSTSTATKGQHCRAEVHLTEHGWVPVDPADVRKVVLEEPPGHLALTDPMVTAARTRLFGSWEMNWIAYNTAHDVALPGSTGPAVGFLMYPQAETADGRIDSLDPDAFKYEITSTELV